MPRPNLKVYLDHHIRRDNLLYKPEGKPVGSTQEQPTHLTIRDLWDVRNPRSKARLLRKPDFQRATWAWTPEDCVELLESVLQERVVPSVIMWLSPGGSQYVLDGGHRISVLIAWIKDDWGDKLASDKYTDRIFERDSKAAARKVRELLRKREIGFFDDYMEAETQYGQLEERLGRPPQFGEMEPTTLKQAEMARKWEGVNIGFPIQWVKGDYETAEQSFLKINKTGRQLSYLDAAQVIHDNSNSADRTLFYRDTFDVPRFQPSDIHKVVLELDPKIVITTNYDQIYENYCRQGSGVQGYNVCKYYEQHALNDIRSNIRCILKAHGCTSDPTRLVLTRASYFEARRRHASFFRILDSLFLVNTILFIGVGLSDPDIQLILENAHIAAPSVHTHYALVEGGRHPSIVSTIKNTNNITLLEYPKGDHHLAVTALQDLLVEVIAYRSVHP